MITGTNSSSTLAIQNIHSIPILVNLTASGPYASLLSFSARSFLVPPGETLVAGLSLNTANLPPGTYTVPLNVSAVAINGMLVSAKSSSTQYLTYSVALPAKQANLISQVSSKNGNVTVTLTLLGNKNTSISNAILQTTLPLYTVSNVSQITTYGLPSNVTLTGNVPTIKWQVAFLPPGGSIMLSYQIAHPSNPTALNLIQNLLAVPQTPSTPQLLRTANIQIPTLYVNSTGQVSISVLYTGAVVQNVTFALSSSSSGVRIADPEQTYSATPEELVGSAFSVTTGGTPGTIILQLSVTTSEAGLNYTIPVLVMPESQLQAHPTVPLTLPQIPAAYLEIVGAVALVVVIFSAAKLLAKGGKPPATSKATEELSSLKGRMNRSVEGREEE